jgi:hypothetical protein
MFHGIRHYSLIKLKTRFINKSSIKKIAILLQIFWMPVLLRLNKIIQICYSMTHQIYLKIILMVNRHIYFFTQIKFTMPISITQFLPTLIYTILKLCLLREIMKICPLFAFIPNEFIQHKLRKTTQLAKSIIHQPVQNHLKSRFQMFRHKILNEFIAK